MVESLVLVAHPDDETIWMGGTILRNKKWNWTIVSLCRKNDSDRMPKFQKVCKFYNASSVISDLDDKKLNNLPTEKIIKKIKETLPKNKYDFIFTHGKNGEYGHKRHKEIHRAVKIMLKNRELKCKKVFFFSYSQGRQPVPNTKNLNIAVPNKNAKIKINLSEDNFKKKRMLINDKYGFGGDSFEALSCSSIEAFD